MSYSALEKRLPKIPEECMAQIVDYVDYMIDKYSKDNDNHDCSALFGKSNSSYDGLEIQRRMRDEWK